LSLLTLEPLSTIISTGLISSNGSARDGFKNAHAKSNREVTDRLHVAAPKMLCSRRLGYEADVERHLAMITFLNHKQSRIFSSVHLRLWLLPGTTLRTRASLLLV
jgi:hypothetical protein